MRIRFLPSFTLLIGALGCAQAQASGDDSCYPAWSPLKRSLDVCNNFAFLSPGNDSRVNLRLLLADRGIEALAPNALSAQEVSAGYGAVPFDVARLRGEGEGGPSDDSATAQLNGRLQSLGLSRSNLDTAGDAFLQGEGSRCRSNTDTSADAFIEQLLGTPELTGGERQALAQARMQLLAACSWAPEQLASVLPEGLQTSQGKAFGTYLRAAGDFYSGRFDEAQAGFLALDSAPQPWLKEVGTYMLARTRLNAAQKDAFDEYGDLKPTQNPATYASVAQALNDYLQRYPSGQYAASAQGLMRRVHWLAGEHEQLAADYAWQLEQANDGQRSVPVEALIQEVDNKLLGTAGGTWPTALLMAVNDLMAMRAEGPLTLTQAQLSAQQSVFEQQPALYQYLQGAYEFYVGNNPSAALARLPGEVPASLDYLAFSQQSLRGFALEAQGDFAAAQAVWLKLLPLVRQPLQQAQLQLNLAMNYERAGELATVFSADSPITAEQVRLILLGKVASAALLRQQGEQGISDQEKATAYFALLYKALTRGQYATFADDLKALPPALAQVKLDSSLGYVYGPGQSLQLFQWSGEQAASGYSCPSIGETAALLQADAQAPKGLNCLGEFILRNGLDSMPLDQRPGADQLGGTQPAFTGAVFSRLEGYQQVIANPKVERDDKAYALFRAINCYGPSGYNSCGGEDVAPAVRKGWFKQLKGTYANTPWAKALQYYW